MKKKKQRIKNRRNVLDKEGKNPSGVVYIANNLSDQTQYCCIAACVPFLYLSNPLNCSSC